MKNSQILKQLGILDTAAGITSRRSQRTTKNSNPEAEAAAAVVTAEEEDDEKTTEEETMLEHPPTVSVLSKEQLVQLLKPERERGRQPRAAATTQAQAQQGKSAALEDDSFEGKFVNLVDLLLPVPAKGEFDVKKIKSSLYFFS